MEYFEHKFQQIQAKLEILWADKDRLSLGPLDDHEKFLLTLSQADLSEISLKQYFCFFSYFENYVGIQAKKNDQIKDRDFTHSEFGYFCFPAVTEESFKNEIALLHILNEGMQYSQELHNLIDKITASLLEELYSNEENLDNIRDWDSFTNEEKTTKAQGFLYLHSEVAKQMLDIEVKEAPLYLWEAYNPDYSTMFCFCPSFDELHLLDEEGQAHIIWNTQEPSALTLYEFLGLLIHEKTHNLIWQIALHENNGLALPEGFLQEDAEKKKLKSHYHIGNVAPIQSLYFSDPEEVICYHVQKTIERSVQPPSYEPETVSEPIPPERG